MVLREVLRARVEQLRPSGRPRLSDDHLDRALVISGGLRTFIAPDSNIDRAGIAAISTALLRDLEARGEGRINSPFWVVHDSSGRTESDVTWGLSYAAARILVSVESRLLDEDAHRFRP